MILKPCLTPLTLISGVIIPETFLSAISSKNFRIKVDFPHPGLPVMKIFILLPAPEQNMPKAVPAAVFFDDFERLEFPAEQP